MSVIIAAVGPVLAVLRNRQHFDLHGGRGETLGVEKHRLRRCFVIGEVAAAFLLLAATGLFLASLRKLQQVNPGFDPHHVIAAQVPFAGHEFLTSGQRQASFVSTVVANLASQPGVVAAAAVSPLPFDPGSLQSCSFKIAGRPKTSEIPVRTASSHWQRPAIST